MPFLHISWPTLHVLLPTLQHPSSHQQHRTTMQPSIAKEELKTLEAKLQSVDAGQLGISPTPQGSLLKHSFLIYQ